ncbi:hypothetical protein WDZ92_40070, partial [Nostoc sp. NIES-2111]
MRPLVPPRLVGVNLTQFFGAPPYPGLDPGLREFQVEIADPTILSLISPNLPLVAGQANFLRFRALRPGTTTIRLVPPPGYAILLDSDSTARVSVTGSFIAVTCPKDLGYDGAVVCQLPEGAPSGLSIRSGSAARLMLTRAPLPDIYSQISFTPQQSPDSFQVIGLTRAGTTDITLSAPGYVDTVLTFQHRDSAFLFAEALRPPFSVTAKVDTPASLSIRLFALGSDGRPITDAPQFLRPGALPVTLTVTPQNSALVRVETPTVILRSSDFAGFPVPFRPLAPG